MNDHLVLISGSSTTGKSASLMNLDNPEGVMYLNCEAGKKLPFRCKFQQYTITDPLQVLEAFEHAEEDSAIHTIVVDSISYLLEMYVSVHVLPSSDTRGAWGHLAQYFKNLMQQTVAKSTKNVIMTAHTLSVLTEGDGGQVMEVKVPVQGSLKNVGIESYFSTVVSTKKVKLKDLEDYESELLNITSDDEAVGFKYVFQTKLTKDTVNERIRSPLGMFTNKETYMDNDAQALLNTLHEFYS